MLAGVIGLLAGDATENQVSCRFRGSACISPATRSAPPRSWRSVAGRLVEPGPSDGRAPARGASEALVDLLSSAPFRRTVKTAPKRLPERHRGCFRPT